MRGWSGAASDARGFLFAPPRLAAFACAAAFTLSLGLALGWARVREASAPSKAATVAVWVSDRDADQVIGLDANLLPLLSVAIRAPIELEGRTDGGVWVISAMSGDPLGRHQLLRLTAAGAVAARARSAIFLDLCGDEQGRAAVVDSDPSGERVHLYDPNAAIVWERAWPAARCAAPQGSRILVGTAGGELALFDLGSTGGPLARVAWGGSIADVAAGPTPGTWWVLDAHGYGRLALFDATLSVLWTRAVGLHALHFAPERGVERVWIADVTEPRVRRFGAGGQLEIDRPDMPLGGLDRACATTSGSALFTAPGALLRLDALGQNAPGQAGFDFLVDVASVP